MLLANMLNAGLVSELFAEFEGADDYEGPSYDDWMVANKIDYESMTDQQIYNVLPAQIKSMVGDIVMNESWYHDGM